MPTDLRAEIIRLRMAGMDTAQVALQVGTTADVVSRVWQSYEAVCRAQEGGALKVRRKCRDPLPQRPALVGQCPAERAFHLLVIDIERAALTSRNV